MWIAGEVRDIISRSRREKRYLERKILKMKKELQKEWELFKTYVFVHFSVIYGSAIGVWFMGVSYRAEN